MSEGIMSGFFGIIAALISVFGSIIVAVIQTNKGKWNIPVALWVAIIGLIGSVACCGGTVLGMSLMPDAQASSSPEIIVVSPANDQNDSGQPAVEPSIPIATNQSYNSEPTSPPNTSGSGCFCQPSDCNGTQITQGDNVPASAILEPHAGSRGTLYVYQSSGQAVISGNLWVYVDSNGNPASQSCIDAQLQYFQYNTLQTIK